MQPIHRVFHRLSFVCGMLCAFFTATVGAADDVPARMMPSSLHDEFRAGVARENPNSDREEQPVWRFPRTVGSEGPVESRPWLRNTRYGAPDELQGFRPTLRASGELDVGTTTQRGFFHIRDQVMQPDDFIYFVADDFADGTATPHCGDGTRFEVTLTMCDVVVPPPPSFEKDILPLLAAKCHDCHGADLQEAKLDLRSLSEMLRGGENGPAIIRGDPDGSLLIDLVAQGQMPPGDDEQLTAAELDTLRRWIKAGAPAEENVVSLPLHAQVTDDDRGFWAFQPPRGSVVPQVRNTARVRTTVDAFLLEKLEERGLSFSPDAERGVLIRRTYLDLIGLPPEPEEVKAFLADARPNAYELLIDALLESPHYGERWGRHWLDATGYVDGKLDNDLGTIYPNEGIWRYRDYVIQSFNDDKPFDQFLTEQIAGDELVDWRKAETFDARTVSLLTATGFLRNVDDHTDFPQYGIEKRYEVVNETLDMFSTAILGLTMECCRCHNHKYDPLPQRDYYRLMACFEPAFNVHAWKPPKDRFLPDVSPAERAAIDRRNTEIDQQVAELSQGEANTRRLVRERVFETRLTSIPEQIRGDVRRAVDMQPELRGELQRYLAEKFAATLQVADADVDSALTDAEKAALQASADQRTSLSSQKKTYGVVQALWDVGPPPVSHIHRRGNVQAHGVLVHAGFPEILQPAASRKAVETAEAMGETSGRRLALARWLTQPDHPLTARVFVNRVWHHHFGRGIVETLGNFGHSGSLPTHPELLDWLAVDFMENGWSIKRLHRQIMLSTAYRQSSRRSARGTEGSTSEATGEEADPDNRLLWRMNLRRLEAEIVRDSVLTVSGSLDRTAGGPPVEITNPADGLSEAKAAPTPTSPNRRSIYLFARRVYPLKFLEIFDAPIMPVNCTQRTNSVTVLQSLALLNSEFLFTQADQMATRIVTQVGPEPGAHMKLAFELTLAREPSDAEIQKSFAFLEAQTRGYRSPETPMEQASRMALTDMCHMLLSSNEFLYVE
jgi:hypothetical protein